MKIDPAVFERCFVEFIAKTAKDNKWSQRRLAFAAFGEEPASEVKWRAIRNEGQRLTISEAVQLLNALNLEFDSFAFRALEHYKMKRNPQKHQDQNRASG